MKKNFKLVLALVLALMMVMGMTSAMAAVNITISRDTTYQAGATGDREFTYKQIFRATETTNHTSTGGGYDTDGTPGTITGTPNDGISYYLSSSDTAQISALGTWTDGTPGTWTKASGNNWFKLTKTADGSKYIVEWDNSNTDADTVQLAAAWLNTNYTALASGSLTWNETNKKWTASDLPEGYYLIKGSEGQNLVAATADITINEKNSYPTIDKKQKDNASGTYANDAVNVKVGDIIYYQVEVDVPADANMPIAVIDKMSEGLTYNASSMAITVDGTALDTAKYAVIASGEDEYDADAHWQYKITPDAATKGKTVVFTFTATVNSEALVDTGRENEVTLKYNNNHYVMKDKVEFDIGAAAIIKYDGATAALDKATNTLSQKASDTAIKYLQATFNLTDAAGNAINVTGSNGVYTVDASSNSNSVTTNKSADGGLLIYGLDPDVTYKLTETATEAGYNLLDAPVTLTVVKSEKTTNSDVANTIKAVAGSLSAGKSDADDAHTLTLTAQQITKVENLQGTLLPSTGGIGTTIFYVGGSILVLAAAILLITKRRMSNND